VVVRIDRSLQHQSVNFAYKSRYCMQFFEQHQSRLQLPHTSRLSTLCAACACTTVLAVRVGETGYLCEQTPEAFAAAMLKFVQQPALTATMGAKGQQHVTNSFGLKVLDSTDSQQYLLRCVYVYTVRDRYCCKRRGCLCRVLKALLCLCFLVLYSFALRLNFSGHLYSSRLCLVSTIADCHELYMCVHYVDRHHSLCRHSAAHLSRLCLTWSHCTVAAVIAVVIVVAICCL
jgi:hypothetical protein